MNSIYTSRVHAAALNELYTSGVHTAALNELYHFICCFIANSLVPSLLPDPPLFGLKNGFGGA